MVETSLILLVFLMMLIGTIDFGQVLYFHQSLVERARAAARYGAINPTDTTGIKNMAVYNVATYGTAPPAVLPGMTTSMVGVQDLGINTPEARIMVTISGYPINFISPYIAQQFNNRPVIVTLSAESQVP
ncbi:MAG: TadE family protein [Bryobacterales bacterium]|nr:TadE family protein [Bryobacterales bacterium]